MKNLNEQFSTYNPKETIKSPKARLPKKPSRESKPTIGTSPKSGKKIKQSQDFTNSKHFPNNEF